MKKKTFLFTLLAAVGMLLTTSLSAQAQSRPGGLFGDPVFSSSSSEGLMDRGTEAGGYNLSNQQFGSDNGGYQLSNQIFGQESPVGSGLETTPDSINARGSLYEATRKAWRADLKRAKRYKYVLSVVYGIVREVYEAKEWYQMGDRIAFRGEPTTALAALKGKRIPAKYRAKGAAYPFLYKK